MYQIGTLIVYGGEGVCRVKAIGPLEMSGVQKGREYYTLAPLYRSGTIFAPVDTSVYTSPIMTREQADALDIPMDNVKDYIAHRLAAQAAE